MLFHDLTNHVVCYVLSTRKTIIALLEYFHLSTFTAEDIPDLSTSLQSYPQSIKPLSCLPAYMPFISLAGKPFILHSLDGYPLFCFETKTLIRIQHIAWISEYYTIVLYIKGKLSDQQANRSSFSSSDN